MTKDKFETLCEQVLLPKLDAVMHRQLTDMQDALEAINRELIRIGQRLSRIELAQSSAAENYEDRR